MFEDDRPGTFSAERARLIFAIPSSMKHGSPGYLTRFHGSSSIVSIYTENTYFHAAVDIHIN